MRSILLVKTSSLGDVVHNLPVASDIRARFPGARIDWVVEKAFADIPRLHPGVRRVIPVAVRRWRRNLLAAASWGELREYRTAVRCERYDLVLDTQGLIKSALLARQAPGPRAGYAAEAAREPLAARFYDATYAIPGGVEAYRVHGRAGLPPARMAFRSPSLATCCCNRMTFCTFTITRAARCKPAAAINGATSRPEWS